MKIAIEGMDGTGKTTVAKAISETLNYIYVKCIQNYKIFILKIRN